MLKVYSPLVLSNKIKHVVCCCFLFLFCFVFCFCFVVVVFSVVLQNNAKHILHQTCLGDFIRAQSYTTEIFSASAMLSTSAIKCYGSSYLQRNCCQLKLYENSYLHQKFWSFLHLKLRLYTQTHRQYLLSTSAVKKYLKVYT